MVSYNEIIGALTYRVNEALNKDSKFLEDLEKYKFHKVVTHEGKLHLWHFPGTQEEIAGTMQWLGKDPKGQHIKFPAILNFQNVYALKGRNFGQQPGTTRIGYTLAIASIVDRDWTTEQRDKYVFRYLLRPIYDEFIRQIRKMKIFLIPISGIVHTYLEVYTSGVPLRIVQGVRSAMPESIKDFYGDYMDFIQLSNFQLILIDNKCLPLEEAIREDSEKVTKQIKEILQL